MSSDPRTPSNGDGAHSTPTRRTMLNALAVLPVAGGALIGAEAGAGETSPATPGSSLRELHRRWSALIDEIEAIEIEVQDVMEDRDECGWPSMTHDEHHLFPDSIAAELEGIGRSDASQDNLWRRAELRPRLADIETNPAKYAPLQAAAEAAYSAREAEFHGKAALHGLMPKIDRQRAAKAALEQVRDTIWETPAATIEDVAALLDIALEEFEHKPGAEAPWDEWPWFFAMMGKLRALAPTVEFTWLRRYSPPGRDLAAEAFDDPPAAEPA